MANGVFNIAKGKGISFHDSNPALWTIVLLKVVEVDDTLNNYDDMSTLLAAAGNTEADFTNYARKTALTSSHVLDDTGNTSTLDLADQTFTAAGGATNNTLVKAIIAYQNGAGDANLIPVTYHDFSATTDGNDLVVQIANFYQAS